MFPSVPREGCFGALGKLSFVIVGFFGNFIYIFTVATTCG